MATRCLIVGLGNYNMSGTRHSVGRAVVNAIAASHNVAWTKEAGVRGQVAVIPHVEGPGGQDLELVLFKPATLMNVCGPAIAGCARQYDVPLERLMAVHDDLERALGKVAIKAGGSANGHNGVRSMQSSLRSLDFPRLRFGIGRPENREDVGDYVLETLTREVSPCVTGKVGVYTWIGTGNN